VSVRVVAKVLLALLASLAVAVILVAGLIWAVLTEPWPISRHQGPDTDYAKTLYRVLLNTPPPAGVQGLYAREEWGFGGDSIYSLRFRFEDPAIVAGIVATPRWERVRIEDLSRLRYLAAPQWWPSEAKLRGLTEAYQNRNVEVLWVDRANRQVYFQRANLCCALAPAAPVIGRFLEGSGIGAIIAVYDGQRAGRGRRSR
jgi:hypothetical protein